MPKRRQVFEVFAPVEGIKSLTPNTIMSPRSQPTGNNATYLDGYNGKDVGTSLYSSDTTGGKLALPVTGLFEAEFANGNQLQVLTDTGVYKYTGSGAALTFVSDGQAFSGTYSDYWSGCMHIDKFYYNNGINNIQVKSSYAGTGTNCNSAVTPTTYKAWGLLSVAEHLCLYHTIEDGTEYYKRVRWSKKGILTPTGTDDFNSGTYGALDLPDVEGEIQCAVPLVGNSAVILANRSIHAQNWVGGSEVYQFPKAISGVGTPSRRGAVSYKSVVYFIGDYSFYAYYGGDDLRDIGESVKSLAFNDINKGSLGNSYVEIDPNNDEILFHVPTGTATLPNIAWVYNIANQTWAKRDNTYTSYGRYTRSTGLTWGELVGNWGAQNWKWGDASVSQGALTRIYGDSSGLVHKVDVTRYSVSEGVTSSPRIYIYVTPDITNANAKDELDSDKVDFTTTNKRWLTCNIDCKGHGTANLSYSTDRGSTYTPFVESPITLVASGTSYGLDLDVDGKQIRVMVTNTGTNEYMGISYLSVEFVPGSNN